ncbi:hypothetical protein HK098_004634 [Nowakowskiella sp. JEL0407]|nr:hypothetical protein HK098_004634 [Nowakowskiella sp. JEL0407]
MAVSNPINEKQNKSEEILHEILEGFTSGNVNGVVDKIETDSTRQTKTFQPVETEDRESVVPSKIQELTVELMEAQQQNSTDPESASSFNHNSESDSFVNSESNIYDVIIIGGGAVGCSIARALSRFTLKVVLVEKSTDVSQGASKANSGIVHGGYDDPHGSLKSKLSHKGNKFFTQLNEELNFGFRRCGSLVLAFTDSEVDGLPPLIENGKKNGVHNLKILNKDEIMRLEPNVNPDVKAALWCPDAGVTPPYLYTIALAENAIRNGVEFRMEHEVLDIERDENGWFSVRCSHESSDIKAKLVVNCAGLYADKVAGMVGADDFRIVPRKGEYILLDKSQGSLVNTVLFPMPSKKFGKGILVSPTFDGNLLIGPTSRGREEAHMTNLEVLKTLLTSARRTLPIFDAKKTITSYAGLRAKSDRGDFIIEESNAVKNFINVAGIDSPGLTSSPAIAEMIVEMLRNELGIKLEEKTNWISNRKGYGDIYANTTMADNIVCLCEGISEAEIVDAVTRREFPAVSTDMVKRRTRAGMGRCQGVRCGEKVAAIIAKEWKIKLEDVERRGPGSYILPHRRITNEDRTLLEELSMGGKSEQQTIKPKL